MAGILLLAVTAWQPHHAPWQPHHAPHALARTRLRTSPVFAKLDEIDAKLLAADATLIFAFSFSRTLSNVLSSPDFPGWFAPIQADPQRLSTTMYFAGEWAVAWIAAGLVCGAFAPGVDEESMRRVGPRGALTTYVFAGALLGGTAFAVTESCAQNLGLVPPPLQITTENAFASLGIGLCLVAWREVVAPYTRYW